MTDADRIKEWVHCFDLQQSGDARLRLLEHLKFMRDSGDKIAREALRQCVELWMR